MTDATEIRDALQALRLDVHEAIQGLRLEVHDALHAIRLDIVRLEAKIDSKPSLMAMFTGILVTVFGMAGVIASTVTALNILGFIRAH